MVVVGPNSVSAAASLAGTGIAWSNPGNIFLSDDIYATLGSAGQSNLLAATAPGFAIPAEGVIDGILVECEMSTANTGSLDEIWLTKDGTTAPGTNLLAAAVNLTTADTYYSGGGSTNLGGTTWTPAQINATTFGALIRASRVTQALRLDHVRITVWYTIPSGDVFIVGFQRIDCGIVALTAAGLNGVLQ